MGKGIFVPIPDCTFGREVRNWTGEAPANDLHDALHTHGMLLFRGLAGISSSDLADQVRLWFPALDIVGPAANRPADGGPMSVLGSTRDANGEFNADYVPAATEGAPLLSPDGAWDAALEDSLKAWIREKRESTFMEWHTDATFITWPTSYAALYCNQAGASSTGYASAEQGLERLPPDLRQIAEEAVCIYRPSIIYGNPKLGIPAIGSRAVQLSAISGGSNSVQVETDGTLEVPPHPDDPVVCHRLVQTHPHTGKRSMRFSLKSLETLVLDSGDRPLPQAEGKRIAWQIMRHATAGPQAYLHRWQEGDLIIWDERGTKHCRVPYDAEHEVREMWRIVFRNDAADEALNQKIPQLNIRRQ